MHKVTHPSGYEVGEGLWAHHGETNVHGREALMAVGDDTFQRPLPDGGRGADGGNQRELKKICPMLYHSSGSGSNAYHSLLGMSPDIRSYILLCSITVASLYDMIMSGGREGPGAR